MTTDQEIIAAFMEPKPATGDGMSAFSEFGWWKAVDGWMTAPSTSRDGRRYGLTLDLLWEVEERLTDQQWNRYVDSILCWDNPRGYLHATPEQKITALATVLRPIVGAREEETR